MKRQLPLILALAMPLLTCAPTNAAVPSAEETSGESVIRAERARFNAAIADRDIEAMRGLFAPSYLLITGRGDRFRGQDANRALWIETFNRDPSFTCRRSSDEVAVNSAWGIAQETGRWACTQTVAGESGEYTGAYAAKWQRSPNGRWMLLSEVFTTLTCEGPPAACRPPDPIVGASDEQN